MNTLPTHIQRSSYAPDYSQRQRDQHLPPEIIEQREKSERMVLRGPGRVGSPACNVIAVFKHCPDDLMEALIYRYNQHNWLLKKIAQQDQTIALHLAQGWRKIGLTIAAGYRAVKKSLQLGRVANDQSDRINK